MLFRTNLLIAFCLAATAEALCDEVPDAVKANEITRLIDQLGDASFKARDEAGKRLQALGQVALPRLRVAARSAGGDLEIRIRARMLVAEIMLAACRSKSTGMKFVFLKEGEFTMGSPPNEADRRVDELQHTVRIARPFLLGTYEVTQEEYLQVMKTQPSWFAATGEGKVKVNRQQTGRFPVDQVSWYDAIEFCNRLSRRDGLPNYYELRDVQRKKESIVTAKVKCIGGRGYRLPTEAEWEYACRAGTSAPYQFGIGLRGQGGNFQTRRSTGYGSRSKVASAGRTTAVGSYASNLWGLYDMHGNVAEWCWDWYDKGYYAKSPSADPQGPESGDHRVLRGGSWLIKQSSCRSATRFWQVPNEGKYITGFRVARSPSQYMVFEQPHLHESLP